MKFKDGIIELDMFEGLPVVISTVITVPKPEPLADLERALRELRERRKRIKELKQDLKSSLSEEARLKKLVAALAPKVKKAVSR